MEWVDYREKLGIGFNDREKADLFFIAVINHLNEFPGEYKAFEWNDYFRFCNTTATPTDQYSGYSYFETVIRVLNTHRNSLQEFLSYYVAFINSLGTTLGKQLLKDSLTEIICNNLSKFHILYEVITDQDGIFIFPKGVEAFDAALVSAPLQWLASYPSAEKAWSKALHEYAESNSQNASEVADKFRKALEIFFKEFFGNDKTLENNKAEYGRYLKSQGVPAEISNNLGFTEKRARRIA